MEVEVVGFDMSLIEVWRGALNKNILLATVFSVASFTLSSAFAETASPDSVKIEDGKVAISLTGVAGDVEAGKAVFAGRKLGNCLACHQNADITNESFHGEVGPPIDGVADRWEAAQLRAIIVNSKAIFGAETIMPGFYNLHKAARIAEDFEGKTILTAQQVEDVIAYLQTLKDE